MNSIEPKTVRVYDADSKTITEIPSCELAPGMVAASQDRAFEAAYAEGVA